MALLFGAHCVDTGGIPMAVRRAGNADMQALQIFSAIPKFYNDKVVHSNMGTTRRFYEC